MADLDKIRLPGASAAATPGQQELAHAIQLVRDHVERNRVIPAHIVERLDKAQYFRLFAPKAMGGLELPPVEGLRAMTAIARLDGSVGWVTMIYGIYSFFAGRLGETVAAEIFGSGKHRLAGVMAPGGRAVPDEGGYRLTGRWPFASGCDHADWLMVGAMVWDGDRPQMRNGGPHIRLFFLPKDRLERYDTWHVTGLQGTGSHDIGLSNAFVSTEYSYDYQADAPTRPEALYQVPVFPLFCAAVAAAAIGIARGAIDAYRHTALKKFSWGSDGQQVALAQKASAQSDLGRAEMLVDGAEMFLHAAIDNLAAAPQGPATAGGDRAKVRAACINAGVNCVQAVGLLRKRVGTTALFRHHPLEKAFRDINTASQHVSLSEDGLDVLGRLSFGFPPNGAV